MKTVNKLDYTYRKLVIKAREQHNKTIDITDEEYAKYYEVEPEPIEPTPGSDIPIPGEEDPDYSKEYLTFEALQNSTFQFTNAINYSIDGGTTWVPLTANTDTPIITTGNKILWKAELTPSASNPQGIGTFSSTGNFNIEGNIMSLLYDNDFKGQISLSGKDWAFYRLFANCSNLINAEYLSLPAITLADYCYDSMFRACTSLISAPELPAIILADGCYISMFQYCTSLTTAPELPATTLAQSCYSDMFVDCINLMTAPELPATTLANGCYFFMFLNTPLLVAPELPAKTLAKNCYTGMFQNCGNLITAPKLPAITLAEHCYQWMFESCTSLMIAPELPAPILTDYCYEGMFWGCTNLTTAPELPAATLVERCYQNIFNGCTNLNYIKAMFTTTPDTSYTGDWVRGVAASGTFIKNSAATWKIYITRGWTIQEIDPETGEIVNEYINE